jgi:pimeloyl-ACP methyl ester carboxylesterase
MKIVIRLFVLITVFITALGAREEAGAQAVILAEGLTTPRSLTVEGGFIYWIEDAIITQSPIRVKKISTAGGTPILLATEGCCYATDVVVDGASVFWSANQGGGSGAILKVGINGGTVTPLAFANQPDDIAIDTNFVYWTENNGGPEFTQGVRKVPLNGGDVVPVTFLGNPLALVLVGSEVYFSYFDFFSNDNRIGLVSKEGGAVTPLVVTVSRASSIIADTTHVYWSEFDAGTINKMPLGGGSITTLASGLNQPWKLTVDASSVYWIEYANGVAGAGTLKKVSLSGGQVTTLAANLNAPNSITADSGGIYWSEWGVEGRNGAIKKISLVTETKLPVVLIHGIGGNCNSFGQMSDVLQRKGIESVQCFAYDSRFANTLITIEDLASEFGAYIRSLIRQLQGTKQVDVIAHSMGGLIVRAWMAGQINAAVPYNGEIRRLVLIATPNYGADGAKLRVLANIFGLPTSLLNEMNFSSEFIAGTGSV